MLIIILGNYQKCPLPLITRDLNVLVNMQGKRFKHNAFVHFPETENIEWGDGGWGRECLLLGGIVGMEWLYVTLGMGGPGEAFWPGLYRKEIFQSFG